MSFSTDVRYIVKLFKNNNTSLKLGITMSLSDFSDALYYSIMWLPLVSTTIRTKWGNFTEKKPEFDVINVKCRHPAAFVVFTYRCDIRKYGIASPKVVRLND